MGISKKGSTWYYKFMIAGKLYCGTCEGVNSLVAARAYERRKKEEVKSIRQHKTIGALVQDYKRELAGGRDIPLSEVWPLFVSKPRKNAMGEKWKGMKESAWNDFLEYLSEKYPQVEHMGQLQERHFSEYVSYLHENGRWIKQIQMEDGRKFTTYSSKLSPRSILLFIRTLKEICTVVGPEAGLIENPLVKISSPKNEYEHRDVFSLEDMKRLFECEDVFCRPLFRIGIATAMRLGDICTLKKAEIYYAQALIVRNTRKTKNALRIPLSAEMGNYLAGLSAAAIDSEYLLPVHSEMYSKNPCGVVYRINNCLESMGFKTTREVEGRTRKFAALGFHSIRHSVLHWLTMKGTPISAVKALAGHTQLITTTRYIDHAKAEDARPALEGLISDGSTNDAALRAELMRLIKTAPMKTLLKIRKSLNRCA